MPTLGGSVFVRNAVKYDYCIAEAIESLSECCDKVAVLEVESEDGTLELLQDTASRLSNVEVHQGGEWECADNYLRLSILANLAKSRLDTDWHFMLQADEVIHEDSFSYIRQAIESKQFESYTVRRFNLYMDFDHCVRLDSAKKPVSDTIVRLAKLKYEAYSDAESLAGGNCNGSFVDKIVIFHYGFVRDRRVMVDKVIDMQRWFHGSHATPDSRVMKMKQEGREFKATEIMEPKEFMRVPMGHPKFARQWVADRKGRY